MRVKLIPNQAAKEQLQHLVEGRKIIHILCEENETDIKARRTKLKSYADKRNKQVKCLTNGKVYSSATKAAKELNVSKQSISKVCNGRMMSVKGYVLKYI